MSPKFYPSVMCMKEPPPEEDIPFLESLGVDGFHVDIMDGIFVDGFISANILHRVRGYTALPLGVHLMVQHPLDYLEQLYESQPETIYVHFEAVNPDACLVDIRKHGCAAGLAVCPETPAEAIAELLPMVDRLLLLRVPPGTTGQAPVSHVDEKIERLVRTPSRQFEITCDGAISATFVQKWFSWGGVSYFVLGKSSMLFDRKCNRVHTYKKLQAAARYDRTFFRRASGVASLREI